MKKNSKVIKYIIINIIILIIIYLFYLKGIRICLIYNIFKIPCSGCGLTRSVIFLLKGDVVNSIRYNACGIPICLIYIVSMIWYIIDSINGKKTLDIFLNKNKKKIIIISVIVFIINFAINITNPLLY